MATCSRCQGEGRETYDEDGRTVSDVCYHCAGSGQVDEETDFQDRLGSVASSIAYVLESEYRKACNSDPEGDGYDLGAYENQMMPYDYFRSRVWDRTYEIAEKLSAMSQADQEFLVAWNELPPEPVLLIDELLKCKPEIQDACTRMVEVAFPLHSASMDPNDDIPF